MNRTLTNTLGRITAPVLVALVVAAGLAVRTPTADLSEAQTIATGSGQTHYLPWDAQQLLDMLVASNGSAPTSPMRLVGSIVSALDGNEVAIDHWEDGYDLDPINAPSATTERFTMNEGETRVLNSLVPVGDIGNVSAGYYDGRDRIVSTGAVVVTAGGWSEGLGTVHPAAAVVPEVSSYGSQFVSPVGQDAPHPASSPSASIWEYVGLIVQASEDDTTVTFEGGATALLDAGESYLLNGGVNLGDEVTADRPIAVILGTGDPGHNYEGRHFNLHPTSAWSDDYTTPVGGRNTGNHASRVFFYNPGPGAIDVDFTTSGGTTGTVSVPAGGQGSRLVPTDQGVRYTSPGNPFYALQAVTTAESGFTDNTATHDWGTALTPSSSLTPMVVVGYAPGANGSPVPAVDSPVWVAAEAATTIYIDLDADPSTGANTDVNGNRYDFSCAAGAYQPRLIKDDGSLVCHSVSGYSRTKAVSSSDGDMTGARIYTVDGTSITAAWGQVAGAATAGNPAIDMGTTVLPFPVVDLQKDAEIVDDDGDGLAVPGDTIRYTITITNRGIQPVEDLTLTDDVPAHTTYVAGTTATNGNPVVDDAGPATPFPLDEAGMLLPPAIAVGETRTVTFDVIVDDPLAAGVTEIENVVLLDTAYGTYTDLEITPVADPGSIGDRIWDDADGDGVQDIGEPGLVGVTVELLDGDGDVTATEVTGPDGAYTFADVYPGTYTVRVDPTSLAAGLAPTYDLDGTGTAHEASFTLSAGQDRTDVDFGYATATISLAKTVYAGPAGSCPGTELVSGENGDALTYCFRVTNTGVIDLSDVGVDDPDLDIDTSDMTVVSGSPGTLAAGQSVLFSYSGAVIDGDLVNTAEAEAFIGTGAGGSRVTDTDTAEVEEIGPDIAIEKTVYRGHDDGAGCPGGELVQARPGQDVTYCFIVTNAGETPLAAIAVTDPLVGIGDGDLVHAQLDPGESVTLYVEAGVDGDLLNTAHVVGTSPAGAQPTDEDTAEVDEIHPSITIDKTIYRGHDAGQGCEGTESATVLDGDPVTWCFAITNDGDVDLTDITVEDLPLLADETDLTVLSGSLATLADGASVVAYLETTATGDVVNTATATGIPPVGPEVSADDTASQVVIDPGVTLEKTVYAGHDDGAGCDGDELVTGLPGADVTYCFRVTNTTGGGPLADIVLEDLDVDDAGLRLLSGRVTPLADGQSATWYLESSIDGDLVNTATVTATPAAGPDVTDEDTAEVDEVNAGIEIDKAVYLGHDRGGGCATAGESVADENGRPVTWCFTVTNRGDAPLTSIQVDDLDLDVDQTDLTVLSGSLASLAPGASVVLYLQGALDGDLTNTATASGTPPVGPDPTDDDTASVDELVPGYTLSKTVYRGHDAGVGCEGEEQVLARPGDAVTWCFRVLNTGDTVLDVRVTDPDLGFDETVLDLAPGDSDTLFVQGAVDGSLVNTATAEGTPPHGPPLPEEDDAEVVEIRPGLSIAKTVYGGHDDGAGCPGEELYADEAGQDVTWCFVVTNTGDVDLVDVTVDDLDLVVDEADLDVLSGSLDTLAAGSSVVLYLEGSLDIDLVNTATATGQPPVGAYVTDEDDAEVEVLVPGVAIDKSVYAGDDDGASCEGAERVFAQAGDDVTWCFRVTNTGEVPLDVTVDDPDVGFTDTVDGLAPGASVTLWTTGTVEEDVVNTATATGETPDGDEVTDDDDAEVDVIDPSIAVAKTVYRGHDGGASCAGAELVEAEVGEAVTWCFVITNTGDSGLEDIVLDDPVLGVDEDDVTILSGGLDSLAPEAAIVAYLEGIVPGSRLNTAAVAGSAPDGSEPTDSDTAEVRAIGPDIGLAKRIVAGPTGNGDGSYALTYRIRVSNAGETRLDGVQVTDDLSATFAGARRFEVTGLSSTDLTVNWPGYTGKPQGSIALLAGTDQLEVGERGDLEVTVSVDPGANLGPYLNLARGTAASPQGEDVSDDSDSGSNADPADPNPGEPGDSGGTDDPVPVEFPPIDLTIAKTVGDIRVDGNVGIVDWRIVVTNDGPGDDPGPITVTDELDERLSFITATGGGWDCSARARLVTCVRAAPLRAGSSAPAIRLLTELTVTGPTEVTNAAHVASTGTESRTDNNDDDVVVTADVPGVDIPGDESRTGTLPRTGAAIGTLVLLGLALVSGGRWLQRRSAGATA